MKLVIALALVLLAAPVAAQNNVGKVSDDYVFMLLAPDFQYRTDRSVVVPLQANLVLNGVPQANQVDVRVEDEAGRPVPLMSGGSALQAIEPYPSVAALNFGTLEAGLYRVNVYGEAGGLTSLKVLEFNVVKPPREYSAALLGRGEEGRFIFEAKNEADLFTLTVYRNGPGGRVVLEEVKTNATTLKVPYVPGEPVLVDVVGPNGWTNAENKRVDFLTGRTTYGPWSWFPDYDQTANAKARSWENMGLGVGMAVGGAAVVLYMVRRRPTA